MCMVVLAAKVERSKIMTWHAITRADKNISTVYKRKLLPVCLAAKIYENTVARVHWPIQISSYILLLIGEQL